MPRKLRAVGETISWCNNSSRDLLLYRDRGRLIRALMKAVVVVMLIWAIATMADMHKGYQIKIAGKDAYRISVTVSRKQAWQYYEKAVKAQGYAVLRDVRLPNGFLATSAIDMADLVEFLQGDAERMIVVSDWRRVDYPEMQVLEADNAVTVNVELSYVELQQAQRMAKQENTDSYVIRWGVKMPDGHDACCMLTVAQMEDYCRRMHVVGADKMIAPFYFPLDVTKPMMNAPRVVM